MATKACNLAPSGYSSENPSAARIAKPGRCKENLARGEKVIHEGVAGQRAPPTGNSNAANGSNSRDGRSRNKERSSHQKDERRGAEDIRRRICLLKTS